MNKRLKISILVDDPDSWIVPYAKDLCGRLAFAHTVKLYFDAEKIPHGDILFLLGCSSIVKRDILKRNRHNLVVHESDLPRGRGFSPVAWQVLAGKNRIPVVLFEAMEDSDAGPVYLKEQIRLDGGELLQEIRLKQGMKTIEMVLRFLRKWPRIKSTPQIGKPTFYRRRYEKDDMIDPRKSTIANFNHLRIVDNEKYPAWFRYKGNRYIIKIYEAKD